MTAFDCALDEHCPAAQVCYANASWYAARAAEWTLTADGDVPALSGCNCSTWFGWTNYPKCDSFDSALVVSNAVVHSVLAALALLGVLLTLTDLALVARVLRNQRKRLGYVESIHEYMLLDLVLFLFGYGLLLGSHIGYVLAELHPTETPCYDRSEFRDKTACRREEAHSLTLLGVSFFMVALAILSTLILLLAQASFRGKKVDFMLAHTATNKIFVLCFGAAFLSVTLPVHFVLGINYAQLAALPFVVVLVVYGALGYYTLKKALRQILRGTSSSRDRFVAVLREIKLVALIIVFLLTLEIVLGLSGIFLAQNWKEISHFDSLSAPSVLTSVMNIPVLLAPGVASVFLHRRVWRVAEKQDQAPVYPTNSASSAKKASLLGDAASGAYSMPSPQRPSNLSQAPGLDHPSSASSPQALRFPSTGQSPRTPCTPQLDKIWADETLDLQGLGEAEVEPEDEEDGDLHGLQTRGEHHLSIA